MTPNNEGLTFTSLSCSNVTSLDEGLTFTPFNSFHFIKGKKKQLFFSHHQMQNRASIYLFLHYDYVNSLFKFHVNDDETI